MNLIKRQSPARIIAAGFAFLIILGSVLLRLPCSVNKGVSVKYIDAFYTATSAVCVTGLSVVDAADTFTPLGRFFLLMLIQFGGLGVTTMGVGVILALRKRVNIKERVLIRESFNVATGSGLVRLIRKIFAVTLFFELLGAILCFCVFVKSYSPLAALGMSFFHSISAFNNAGFDVFGGFQSLTAFENNAPLCIITCFLIFFGGIGFLVITELYGFIRCGKKLSMHARAVLLTSVSLIGCGTVLLRLTENVTWLGAFFQSVSARTAGFTVYSLDLFSKSGLLLICILMLIGASPGSTGGGIKTSTFFVLLVGIRAAATGSSEKAFRYAIPAAAFKKASVILLLALSVITAGTYLICIFEPEKTFLQLLFEIISAFGTTGLSTGITPTLCGKSKILSVIIMYIGRLGPLTAASLWYFSKGERFGYPEGNITVG